VSVRTCYITYIHVHVQQLGKYSLFYWCIEVVAAYVSLLCVLSSKKNKKQKENKQWADNPYTWMYGIGYTWTEMRSEDRMIQSRILY